MSQSLKSWLFERMADQAHDALESGTTLYDLPFTTGNRVQLVRFLTFRPPDDPLADRDVWAVVSDRTHVMAAKFVRGQVTRFQRNNPTLPFTTLRGALLMLRATRAIITRIPSASKATMWDENDFNLALEVRSFDLLGSIGEPTFWPDAKLVLSPRGVPAELEHRWKLLTEWVDKWRRYRLKREERKRASATLKAVHDSEARHEPSLDALQSTPLPTPGQRVRSDPAVNLTRSAERTSRSQSDSRLILQRRDADETGLTQLAGVSRRSARSAWDGYDIDAAVPSTMAVFSEPPPSAGPPPPPSGIDRAADACAGMSFLSTTEEAESLSICHVPEPRCRIPPPASLDGAWNDEAIPDPSDLGLSPIELTPEELIASDAAALPASRLLSTPKPAVAPAATTTTQVAPAATSPPTPSLSFDLASTPTLLHSFAATPSRRRSQLAASTTSNIPASPRPSASALDSKPDGTRPAPTTTTTTTTVRFKDAASPARARPAAAAAAAAADGEGGSKERKRRRGGSDPPDDPIRARKRKSEARDKLKMLMASIVD
ncbi:uncharacterized protein PFL1_04580 [Pseudozyma flocculosa PF-1]|uniref:Telomere replication protein EST3 n=1 Tax=Pseudozyma flocculosa PF-1 TaxID=1277687 RepID=A0A061H744_9BASI|nr:uncharacterized protein PFL1_04580 [Pseudozyma flocculosa PF-1]EPQ27835.1 hypothetical protein PFL1_04580 [Pseudozyma flocculosa PF-1]